MSEGAEEAAVTATGRCLCGGVRFRTTGPLRPVWQCACHRCRRYVVLPPGLTELPYDWGS